MTLLLHSLIASISKWRDSGISIAVFPKRFFMTRLSRWYQSWGEEGGQAVKFKAEERAGPGSVATSLLIAKHSTLSVPWRHTPPIGNVTLFSVEVFVEFHHLNIARAWRNCVNFCSPYSSRSIEVMLMLIASLAQKVPSDLFYYVRSVADRHIFL